MNSENHQIIEIYCDESGHELLTSAPDKRKGRYFGIGAIRIDAADRERLKKEFREIKEEHKIPWEIKWRKISNSNIKFYLDIIDWFIQSPINFRLVRIDTDNLDLAFWHDQDAELGFYKFYYQCLKHIMCQEFEYLVFTDFKTNRDKTRLKKLQLFLNHYTTAKVTTVQALSSKDSIFIQLADLFTGAAIASHNNHILSAGKKTFCIHLAKCLKKESLAFCSTRFSDPSFNIFCLEFGRNK